MNGDYLVTHEEWVRLENIQREIAQWRADLFREWELKRFTPGERYLSKERFHNDIRDTWKIYTGFKITLLKAE